MSDKKKTIIEGVFHTFPQGRPERMPGYYKEGYTKGKNVDETVFRTKK